MFSVLGGASYNREKFFEEEVVSSTEALAGVTLEAFRYNTPKLSLNTSFVAYPGLTNFGRLRLKLNSSLRFELIKDFFSESVKNVEGEDVSTREIKKILETVIREEDKRKPLTDDKLAGILKEKGYPIARRTVAKYREQLDIPVARLRKEI